MTRFYLLAGLEGVLLLSIHLLPLHPAVALVCAAIASSAVYLGVAYQITRTEFSRTALLCILFLSLLLRASYLTTTPIGSDDFYRYLWDGKIQSHGINPYRLAPAAEELQPFHTGSIPANVNHPEMKTVYFPFVQWFFTLAYQMTGDSILGFKILLLLAECSTMVLLWFLLLRLDLPPKLTLLYALCPLPVFQFALDAHLDGLGLPLLAAALLLFARERSAWSLLLLSLSISVKPVGLVLLPLWFLHEKGVAARARVLAFPAIVLGLQFLPYAFDANPLEGLTTFTGHWMYNGMAFSIIHSIVPHNQIARTLCALLLAVILFMVYRGKTPWPDKVYRAILALLLCSPVVHPWYVGWMALLIPVARRWSGIVLASTVSLTSITAARYILTGDWVEEPIILALEYLPVVFLVALEIRKDARRRPG